MSASEWQGEGRVEWRGERFSDMGLTRPAQPYAIAPIHLLPLLATEGTGSGTDYFNHLAFSRPGLAVMLLSAYKGVPSTHAPHRDSRSHHSY